MRHRICVQVSDILHVDSDNNMQFNESLYSALQTYRRTYTDFVILLEPSPYQDIHDMGLRKQTFRYTDDIKSKLLEKIPGVKFSESISIKEGSLTLGDCQSQDYEHSFLIRHINADIQPIDHDSLKKQKVTLIDFKTSHITEKDLKESKERIKKLLETQQFSSVMLVCDTDETIGCNLRTKFRLETVVNRSVIESVISLQEFISENFSEIKKIESYLMTARDKNYEIKVRKENDPAATNRIVEKTKELGLTLSLDDDHSFSFPNHPDIITLENFTTKIEHSDKQFVKEKKVTDCLLIIIDNSDVETNIDNDAIHLYIKNAWKAPEINCELLTIHVKEKCFSEEDQRKLKTLLIPPKRKNRQGNTFFIQAPTKPDQKEKLKPTTTLLDEEFDSYVCSAFSTTP